MKKYLLIAVCLFFNQLLKAQIVTIQSADATNLFAKNQNNYFRVVVKGFTCTRETADDMLERDGKRDEIYLTSTTQMLDISNNSIGQILKRRSRVMGDVNNRNKEERRVLAGSAFGKMGGIASGDNVPKNEPWKNTGKPKADLLPYILWEGTLNTDNTNMVWISPAIFEYDGADDFLTKFWDNSILGNIGQGVALLGSAIFSGVFGGGGGSYDNDAPGVFPAPSLAQNFSNIFSVINTSTATPAQLASWMPYGLDFFSPKDRPIGIQRVSKNNSLVTLYNPLLINLLYKDAVKLSSTDFGYGHGIIPIRYKDFDELKGDYTLYIAVEEVKDASEKNLINITNNESFDNLQSYTLRNANAQDKYADILNGGDANGTLVVLNNAIYANSQRFKLIKANDEYYYITNVMTNKNLAVMFSEGNGANVVIYQRIETGNDFTNWQQWKIIRYCDGSYILQNKRTNKVIEVYNAATTVFSPLGQMPNSLDANQRWFIEK